MYVFVKFIGDLLNNEFGLTNISDHTEGNNRMFSFYPDNSASASGNGFAGLGGFGGYGGYGGPVYGGACPEGVPVEFALLSILAAFATSFGILYRVFTLTTMGRRKKRFSEDGDIVNYIVGIVADLTWKGKKSLIPTFSHVYFISKIY